MARVWFWAMLVCAQCAHAPPLEERAPKWESAGRPDAAFALSHLGGIDVRLHARAGPGDEDYGASEPYLFADRKNKILSLRSMLPPAVSIFDHAGEPALTEELIDEELARVEDEAQDLARSSVDLLPALLASNAPDEWIALRVDQLREALVQQGISSYERDELLVILDEAPWRAAPASDSLSRLRAMLHKINSVPYPMLEKWAFEHRVGFQVRAWMPADRVLPTLEKTERTLRAQLDAAMSVIAPAARTAIERRAIAALATQKTLKPRTPGRTACDLAPPPERARIVALAADLAHASDEPAEIALVIALHEIVATACIAYALHAHAEQTCTRRIELTPDDDAREMRIAANHPISAIANALGAALLVEDGAARALPRARRWTRFGDAPLHIIEWLLATNR